MKTHNQVIIFFIILNIVLSCVHKVGSQGEVLSTNQLSQNVHDIKVDTNVLDLFSYNSKYIFNSKEYNVEWFYIKHKNISSRNIFILFNCESDFFVQDQLLNHWLVKLFVSYYDLVLINTPGFGKSDIVDFAYHKDLIYPIMDSILKNVDINLIEGIWAYGVSTLYAAFYAKKIQHLKYLILGGGFYNLEQIYNTTIDNNFKAKVNKFYNKDVKKYFELNSISWDFSDLPQDLTIVLYHASNDKIANFEQAQEFRDNLSLSGYYVKFHNLENMDHNIPQQIHAQIIDYVFLSTFKTADHE